MNLIRFSLLLCSCSPLPCSLHFRSISRSLSSDLVEKSLGERYKRVRFSSIQFNLTDIFLPAGCCPLAPLDTAAASCYYYNEAWKWKCKWKKETYGLIFKVRGKKERRRRLSKKVDWQETVIKGDHMISTKSCNRQAGWLVMMIIVILISKEVNR